MSPELATSTPRTSETLDARPSLATAAPLPGVVLERLPLHKGHPGTRMRMPYGDPIRVLGTIAVVLGHVCDPPFFDDQPLTPSWWTVAVLDATCRWAVPVYIMLSGALLLDDRKEETLQTFYRKRLARLGVPIVFWSAFFILFAKYYTHGLKSWHAAFVQLAIGEPYGHLHFIFRIAGLYALTPALRVLVKHCPRDVLKTTILVLCAFWGADSIVNGLRGVELSAFARFAPFLGFYLAGYLLRDIRLSRRGLIWCGLGMITCTLVLLANVGLFATQYDVDPYPSIPTLLYDFVSPVRTLMSICAFAVFVTLCRGERFTRSPFARLCAWLAPATLGIYLIHPLFRDVLITKGYYPTHPNVLVGVPLFTLAIYLASAVAVIFLMKIPYIRRIVT